jgi:hypothetical protein
MSRRNMVPKEVIDIEVDERRIYLLECMRGFGQKILEQKNCDNYCLAEKINERKIKFSRYVTPRAFDGVKELIEYLKCTRL